MGSSMKIGAQEQWLKLILCFSKESNSKWKVAWKSEMQNKIYAHDIYV